MRYILLRFMVYGLVGMLMEVMWTGMHSAMKGDSTLRSTTYLWMFPIYGCGILFEPLHDLITPLHWLFRGLIWAFAIFSVEFASGIALRRAIGRCPWDYTAVGVIHLYGVVRLDYLPAWFLVGLGFERLHMFLISIF